MTKDDADIVSHNLHKLRFVGVDPVNQLIRSIESVRNMNSYVNEQLIKLNINNPNKVNDGQLFDCLAEAMLLSSDPYIVNSEKEYKNIWTDTNSFCLRIVVLGDKHNVWEQKIEIG